MKRIEFRLDRHACASFESAVDAAGVSAAEFVRQAVTEKVERDRIRSEMKAMNSSVAELLENIRMENQRVRREMNEDATRHLEQQRREAAASLRKNEELTKTLVMELARSLGGGGKSEPGYGRTDWPDH